MIPFQPSTLSLLRIEYTSLKPVIRMFYWLNYLSLSRVPAIEPLPALIAHGLREERHGHMPEWESALAALPADQREAFEAQLKDAGVM